MDVQIHIFDKHNKHLATEAIFMSTARPKTLATTLRRAATHANKIAEEDYAGKWGTIEIEIKAS